MNVKHFVRHHIYATLLLAILVFGWPFFNPKACLAWGALSGPGQLASGETGTYTNDFGESVSLSMPPDCRGSRTVTIGNESLQIRCSDGSTGYWKLIDQCYWETGDPMACNALGQGISGGISWVDNPVTHEKIIGKYRIWGYTKYFAWEGPRPDMANSRPWVTCPTFGLPVSGPDTLTVCEGTDYEKTLQGEPIARSLSIYKWKEIEYDKDQCPQPSAGNPIQLATGNKFQKEIDLDAGPTPLSLFFNRYYNSQSQMSRNMGYGWSHTYNRFLSFIDSPYEVQGYGLSKILAWRSNGKAVFFDGDTLAAESGAKERLVRNGDDTFTLTTRSNLKETYDQSGRLLFIADLNGNTQTLNYDVDGRLVSVTDPFGRTISFGYNSWDRINELTLPSGEIIDYTYDQDDNLIGVTYPDGEGKTYHYEDTDIHNLTGITNENNVRFATYAYDIQDRAISSTHANGAEEITVSYNSSTRRTVTDANGNTTTYNFTIKQGLGLPTSISGSGCQSCGKSNISSYVYDHDLNITRTTDKRGISTYFTHDANGNVLTRTEAKGKTDERITTYTYTELNKVATIARESVSEPGQQAVTTFVYDATGNLIEKIDSGYSGGVPFSFSTTYQYTIHGQLISIDGPRTDVADVTTFSYDGLGNLLTETRGGILTTTYGNYNAYGRPGQITDPNGAVTQMTYDARNRLITTTSARGTTIYTYDDTSNLTQVELPNGNRTYYTYNDANYPVMASDDMGNYVIYEYDDVGNKTTEAIYDPNGVLKKTLDFQYNTSNRLQSIQYPDGKYENFYYDGNGNRTSHRDENYKNTNYQYDYLDRLKQVTQTGQVYTSYAYDTADNLISVTDAENQVTSYTYDDAGRLLSIVSPDSGTTTHAYDEAGNLKTKTDAGGTTMHYAYDALNRLILIDYPSDPDVIYSYDQEANGAGRLTEMNDGSGVYTYVYDAPGNIIEEEKTIAGETYTTTYSYDGAGLLVGMTYPSGRTVDVSRDATGNIVSISADEEGNNQTLADPIEYLPFGPMTQLTLGNGVTITNTYNHRYQITAIDAGCVQSLAYTTDGAGNITAITDNLNSSQSRTFSYDSLYRLISATGPYGTISYTYDKVGNRLTRTKNGQSDIYAHQSGTNRLTEITGTNPLTFSYDGNGNVTTRGNQSLTYDQNNRLIQARENSSVLGDYTYNANGQRIIKSAAGQSVVYHYDQSGNLIAESTIDGQLTVEYVYLNGIRLATIKGDNIYYHLNDHLGTPLKLIDGTGTVVWQTDEREPFGNTTVSSTSTVDSHFRLPGQYYDSETGLH